MHLTLSQARTLASKYDTDGDGQISLKEFQARMNFLLKRYGVVCVLCSFHPSTTWSNQVVITSWVPNL